MKRFFAVAMKLTEYLAIGVVAMTSVIIVVQVFFRYVLNSSIGWSDEIMGFLLVWITFTGAVLALEDRSHIGVDFLVNFFPVRYKWIIISFIDLLILIFLLIFTYNGGKLCIKLYSNYAISLPISMSIIYFVLPLSGFLMIMIVFRRGFRTFQELRNREK